MRKHSRPTRQSSAIKNACNLKKMEDSTRNTLDEILGMIRKGDE